MELTSDAIIKLIDDFVQLNNLQPIKFDKKRIKALVDICDSRDQLAQLLVSFDKEIQSRKSDGSESVLRNDTQNHTSIKIETQLVFGQEPILLDDSVRYICIAADRVRVEVDFKKFYWRYRESY